jgi:HprK-related kinase A
MTPLGTIPIDRLEAAMRGAGFRLRFGPFIVRIAGAVPDLAAAIQHAYADHELVEDAPAEMTVAVRVTRPKRSPWTRNAQLYLGEMPSMSALPVAYAQPMLEWGLNFIIASRAHNFILVHAATVERNGRIAVLPATSGSGKSTLCAALLAAGWRLFSDEFALIRPQDGMVLPMPRTVSLKNESIAIVRAMHPQAAFSATFENTVKGALAFMRAPADAVARMHEPAPIGAFVFPRFQKDSSLAVETLARSRAIGMLIANSMNYAAHGQRGFDCFADLIETRPAWSLAYGDTAAAQRWFADLAGTWR